MIEKLYSTKAKCLIMTVLIVMVWQFSFPQYITAGEIKINQYNIEENQLICHEEIGQSPDASNTLPKIPDKPPKEIIHLTVTAYSSTPDQTSGDPYITASGSHVRDGVIAANFLPIGAKVRFPEKFGNKIFTVEDRMSARYWYRADIWMPSRELAKEWGVKYTTIEII